MSTLHIHAPKGYYLGQVRGRGERHFVTVTGKCRCPYRAMSRAALRMGGMGSGRVIWCAEWYEPNEVLTWRRA